MSGAQHTRVAIIGARGIGRHHANWWRLEGAEVCAFAGTSPESVANTRTMLRETFGIDARGYADVSNMLETERPDIVDVCSPPDRHYGHVRAALDAGSHVLCEKPFVYESGVPRERLLAQAYDLLQQSERLGRQLGVCTQYSAGAPLLLDLYRERHDDAVMRRYCGHLESPAKGRSPDPVRVWVDLAPHPISVLQTLVPELEVDWGSVRTEFSGYSAIARFDACGRDGRVECEIITRNAVEPPLNVRRFGINDSFFQIEGGKDAEGAYCARVTASDGDCRQHPDFMRLLIRGFLAGRPVADARTGVANLDLLLRFIENSSRNKA